MNHDLSWINTKYVSDINECFINDGPLRLCVPTADRAVQMHRVLNQFSDMHHTFLLWSSGPHSLESVQRSMAEAADNFLHDRNEYRFLIINRDDDALLGCISLFIVNLAIPHYEIGYWLASDATGRGVMTVACRMVTRLASEFLNAKRIDIRTAGRNVQSQAVAVRCGFRLEATLMNHRLDNRGAVDNTCIYVYNG